MHTYSCIHGSVCICIAQQCYLWFYIDINDFDAIPQNITFRHDEDTIVIQITLNDDLILEENEIFIVTLNVTGDVKGVDAENQNTVMVTIKDNDST